jgi:hypothetical protein
MTDVILKSAEEEFKSMSTPTAYIGLILPILSISIFLLARSCPPHPTHAISVDVCTERTGISFRV